MKKVAVILIGLISISSCKKDYEDLLAVDATIASSTVPVVVDSVQIVNEAIPIYAVGRVGTSEETRLSFKIGGVIASMSAEEGDYVKSGQSLARLRTDEIDAQVLKAQQALTKTKRDLARIQQMYEDDAATLENVQDLTTLVEVQQADLDIAKFNQQYASIIAPISGRIIKKSAEPNELISPGKAVYTIAGATGSTYVLKTGLSDRDISRIRKGDQAKVSFDAFDGVELEGRVTEIAESANAVTGTFDIEISLRLGGRRVRNGFIGRAEIIPKDRKSYYKLPVQALAEANAAQVTVYEVDPNKLARERVLNAAYITGAYVYAHIPDVKLSNLVVIGAPSLSDGTEVDVRR